MAENEKSSGAANPSAAQWGAGIAIGMGFGAALGVALESIGIGIALGAAFAVVYALMMGELKKRRDEDGSGEPGGGNAEGPRP